MNIASPNRITGANAGGRRQLPMRTRRTARVAQFRRYAPPFTNPFSTSAARNSFARVMTLARSVASAWLAFVRCNVGVAPWKPIFASVFVPT